jgi:hypothetical protein
MGFNAFDISIPDFTAAREERRKQAAAANKEWQAKRDKEAQEEKELKENLVFRGKPIKLIPLKDTIENALDADNPDTEDKSRYISYEEQLYTKDRFYKAMFTDYRKQPFKVKFNTNNIFYLGSNQRAKLQYHILSQYFELVEVAAQDKKDLEPIPK